MKKYAFLFVFFIAADFCRATIDILEANDLTKELYVYEENNYEGLGWYSLGENADETQWLAKGYSYTGFPYKTESVIAVIGFTSLVFIIRRERRLSAQ